MPPIDRLKSLSMGKVLHKPGQEPWKKKKRGPKFLLDFRNPSDEKMRLKSQKRLRNPRYDPTAESGANRATYFIPTLKIKKNPQLEKIETYFVTDTNIG